MELYFMVIAPILLSLLLYLLPLRASTALAGGVHAALLGAAVHLFWQTRFCRDTIVAQTGAEGLLQITLFCDLIASVFLVLVTFLFFCIFLYSFRKSAANRLYGFLLAVLEGLILLFFLSRDLFNLYVAIEISVVVCAILIMYKRESRSVYDGMVYLLLNIAGMLFFLLGIGLLYRQTGMLDILLIEERMTGMSLKEVALPYALIMTGVCMKCALFPLHFWLPHAHGTPGAPTEVSAVLSGLYVKGGIFLFIRMQQMFSGVIQTGQLFLWIGLSTAFAGIIMAVCQKDMKLILAYHTISQMGLIIAGLSMGSLHSTEGAMLHVVNHALFKSLLFLAAGVIIEKYGTRNVYEVRGVMRRIPIVGIAIAAGILGITGAPLFNGSISKYLIQKGGESLIVEMLLVLINFGTALSFVKFGKMLFGSEAGKREKTEVLSGCVLLVLSSLCLLTGIFAEPFSWLFFGRGLQIDLLSYLQKAAVWLVVIGAAWGFYKLVLSKIGCIRRGISFQVSFNTASLWVAVGFISVFGGTLLTSMI